MDRPSVAPLLRNVVSNVLIRNTPIMLLLYHINTICQVGNYGVLYCEVATVNSCHALNSVIIWLKKCRGSSVVERSFHKRQVVGSIPTLGIVLGTHLTFLACLVYNASNVKLLLIYKIVSELLAPLAKLADAHVSGTWILTDVEVQILWGAHLCFGLIFCKA